MVTFSGAEGQDSNIWNRPGGTIRPQRLSVGIVAGHLTEPHTTHPPSAPRNTRLCLGHPPTLLVCASSGTNPALSIGQVTQSGILSRSIPVFLRMCLKLLDRSPKTVSHVSHSLREPGPHILTRHACCSFFIFKLILRKISSIHQSPENRTINQNTLLIVDFLLSSD